MTPVQRMVMVAGLCVVLSSGCASGAKYRMLANGRMDHYTENFSVPIHQSLQNSMGGTVTTVSGDPNKIITQGYGGGVGVMEEKGAMVSTITVYYLRYSPISYTFNSSLYGTISENLQVSGFGVDGTIGWNIWHLRPGISYKIESQSQQATVTGGGLSSPISTTTRATAYMLGLGLALDLPISTKINLVAQGDYRIPISGNMNSILAQAGLSYAF